MTPLGKILGFLDPRTMAMLVSVKHDEARETFPLQKMTVENVQAFRTVTTEYYKWQFRAIVPNAELPDDYAGPYAWSLIQKAYGHKGGVEAAFRAARFGVDGGLSGVLNAIHMQMKKQQEEAYINHVLHSVIDPLDFDQRVELMREYLGRFANQLSPATKPKSAEELAANWEELLKMTVELLDSLQKNLGRV